MFEGLTMDDSGPHRQSRPTGNEHKDTLLSHVVGIVIYSAVLGLVAWMFG